MSIILTYWQDARSDIKQDDPDAFDGIQEIRLKSIKQIPDLIAARPPHCTMISTEHSAERTLKNGRRTNFFKEVWRGDVKPHYCPTCGRKYDI